MHGQGGIASVLRSYAASKLSADYAVEFVATIEGGSAARRTLDSVLGVGRAMWAVAVSPRPLVHVHMSMGGSFVRKSLIIVFAKALRRPVVLHLHGSDFHAYAVSGGPLRRAMVRYVFSLADRVVVLSEVWRQRVAEFSGRSELLVLPNPVAVPGRLSEPAGSRRVLFAGRLGERKGVPILIAAIEMLQKRGFEAAYVLAGDGDVEATRAAVAVLPRPTEVAVPGWLGETEMARMLEGSAVFCLPSFDEGQPIALLEAMAHGLACVVTPAGGMGETVTDGEDGLLVPAGDAEALADALQRVLSDDALRLRLGRAAHATVAARFSLEQAVGRLEDLYATLGYAARVGGL